MTEPAQKLKHEALDALADEYPNSIVADMLTHFNKDIVLQFLVLYGGRQMSLPKTDSIWVSYRNKVIVGTLDVKNDRVTRHQLAEYFGVLDSDVSKIYYQSKQRKKYLSNAQVQRVVDSIYRKNAEKFHKEMKDLFSNKYGVEYFSVHDELQDPEDQFLLKEALEKLKVRCRKELNAHRVFVGRMYKLDYALKLMMDKIKENH